MKNASKILVILGCLLIVVGVVVRLNPSLNIVIMTTKVKPSSFILLANTSFLLAILLKK